MRQPNSIGRVLTMRFLAVLAAFGVLVCGPTVAQAQTKTTKVGTTTYSSGSGSPEGVVYGSIGDHYQCTASCSGSFEWTKQTGTATNTGWVVIGGGNVSTSGSPANGDIAKFSGSSTVTNAAVTGSGSIVLATSPTLVTPALGTPSSGTATNLTGLPLAGIVAGSDDTVPTSNGSVLQSKALTNCTSSNEAMTYATSTNTWGCHTISAGAISGAPDSAQYWTGAADSGLSAEKDLSALATGLVVNTAGTPSAYAGTSCTNQFPRSLSASGAATCASVAAATDVTGVLPGANGGSLVLLESHAASASSSLDFTTCLSSTYNVYFIEADGVLPTSNGAAIWVRFNTGSGFDTGSNYKYMYSLATTSAFATSANSGSDTKMQIGLSTLSSGSTGGMNFAAYLYNANSASLYKRLRVEGDMLNSGDSNFYYIGGFGIYAVTTALTQFQVLPSTSTIASGTVRCYGVAK